MLKNQSWIIAAGLSAMLVAGCDRSAPSQSQQTPATTPAPATQPAEQASAVLPAEKSAPATAPAADALSFTVTENNVRRTYDFPHVRLHIDPERKIAVLYSDDPKTAINSDYTGNSYYIEIPLPDYFTDHLDGYQWHYKAMSSDRQESAEGIFLEGHMKYQLQPMDVLFVFKGDGSKVKVGVGGEFFKFDLRQNLRDGSLVTVSGIVDADVEVAK